MDLIIEYRNISYQNQLPWKLQLYLFIHSYCLVRLSEKCIVFTLGSSTCKEFQRLMPYMERAMALTFKVKQRLANYFEDVLLLRYRFSQNAFAY